MPLSKFIKLINYNIVDNDLIDLSKKVNILYKFLLYKFPIYFPTKNFSTKFIKEGLIEIDSKTISDTLLRVRIGQNISFKIDYLNYFKESIQRWYSIEKEHSEYFVVNKFVGTSPKLLNYYLSVYQRILAEGSDMNPRYLNEVPDKIYSENENKTLTENQSENYYIKPINIIEKASGGLVLLARNPTTYAQLSNCINVKFYYTIICHGKIEKTDEIIDSLSEYEVDWDSTQYVKTTQPPPNQYITKFVLSTTSVLDTIDIKFKFHDLGISIIGNGKYTVALKNSKDRGMMLSCTQLSFSFPGSDKVNQYQLPIPPKFNSLISREEKFYKEKQTKSFIQIEKSGKSLENIDEDYPIPYQTGVKTFFNINFIVNPKVLIPRPSTETLVTSCIKYIKEASLNENKIKDIKLMDLGTGSGCILLSVLHNCKNVTGTGLDISSDSLDVAKLNATKLKLEHKAKWIEFDMLKGDWNEIESADIILCNPPYLHKNKMDHPSYSKLKHEPKQALFCHETDQSELIFYEKLSQLNQKQFTNNANRRILIIEVGKGLDKRVEELFVNRWTLLEKVYDNQNNMRCLVYQLKL